VVVQLHAHIVSLGARWWWMASLRLPAALPPVWLNTRYSGRRTGPSLVAKSNVCCPCRESKWESCASSPSSGQARTELTRRPLWNTTTEMACVSQSFELWCGVWLGLVLPGVTGVRRKYGTAGEVTDWTPSSRNAAILVSVEVPCFPLRNREVACKNANIRQAEQVVGVQELSPFQRLAPRTVSWWDSFIYFVACRNEGPESKTWAVSNQQLAVCNVRCFRVRAISSGILPST
jgi:hypothetical protein